MSWHIMAHRKKLHLFLLKITFLISFIINCQSIAMDTNLKEHNDPSLFRLITEDGREIYILGSPHLVPLEMLLSPITIKELATLAEKHAILYTEHEIANIIPLEYFNNHENLNSSAIPYGALGISLEVFNKIKSIQIYLNLTHEGIPQNSNVSIEQLLYAHSWLLANILGTHAGILSYHKFGGADYALLYDPIWKEKWGDIRYLETSPDVIKIIKKHHQNTSDTNMESVRKSTTTIVNFITLKEFENEPEFKEMLENGLTEELKSMSKRYSWQAIEFGNRSKIPESAIERSKHWAEVIKIEVNGNKEDLRPILIVVGNAHLAGFYKKFSFLSFLLEKIGIYQILRLTNEGKWVNIS